jgi:hypothetical protein
MSKHLMDFDNQLFPRPSRFSQPSPSQCQCQSIEVATFYSDMALTKRKEQLYWNSMAAPFSVKARQHQLLLKLNWDFQISHNK